MDTYDALAQAAAGTEKIVGRIEPSQLTRPTPCTEWDVRAVCNHLLGSMYLGEAIFKDAPPHHAAAPGGLPDVDLVGDDPAAAYEETAEAMLTAARLDGTLERMHKTPMGEMHGAGLGGFVGLTSSCTAGTSPGQPGSRRRSTPISPRTSSASPSKP